VTNVPVDADGDALTSLPGLAADTYVVQIKIEPANGYWTADPIGLGTINVAIGSNDTQTNAGGWVPDNGSANGKANFGFSVKAIRAHRRGTRSLSSAAPMALTTS
jgi:hypothetical protein